MRIYRCVCLWRPEDNLGGHFQVLPPPPFETGSVTGLSLTNWSTLTGLWAPAISLSLHRELWSYKCPPPCLTCFYVDTENWTLVLVFASIFLTEIFLLSQPLFFSFFNILELNTEQWSVGSVIACQTRGVDLTSVWMKCWTPCCSTFDLLM